MGFSLHGVIAGAALGNRPLRGQAHERIVALEHVLLRVCALHHVDGSVRLGRDLGVAGEAVVLERRVREEGTRAGSGVELYHVAAAAEGAEAGAVLQVDGVLDDLPAVLGAQLLLADGALLVAVHRVLEEEVRARVEHDLRDANPPEERTRSILTQKPLMLCVVLLWRASLLSREVDVVETEAALVPVITALDFQPENMNLLSFYFIFKTQKGAYSIP